MKLRRVLGQADGLLSVHKSLFIIALLVITGCGGDEAGNSGYSQDFPVPEGAAATAAPSGPTLTRSQRRRKEIEESRNEAAAKPKGKRVRP
jgi:hypothetical protein